MKNSRIVEIAQKAIDAFDFDDKFENDIDARHDAEIEAVGLLNEVVESRNNSVTISKADFDKLVGVLQNHNDDWRSGFEDGTYETELPEDMSGLQDRMEGIVEENNFDVPSFIEKTDWNSFLDEKLALIKSVDFFAGYQEDFPEDEQAKENWSEKIESIVNWIDAVQDWAADDLGLGNDKIYPNLGDYPIEDWEYEVRNGDTVLGYAEWNQHKKESDLDES